MVLTGLFVTRFCCRLRFCKWGNMAMDSKTENVTKLLAKLSKDDRAAESELIEIVFPHLRRLAARYMRDERPDHTLQPTALVHEAYLKLVRIEDASWEDRSHFYCLAAKLMRQILVDYARARNAEKRPRGKISLDEAAVYSPGKSSSMLDLHEALDRLASKDARMEKVVELKFFGGLTFEEIGRVLKISEKTAKRDWQMARAWLQREIKSL